MLRIAVCTFVLAVTAIGAIHRDPPGCSTRPCTYTITCAATDCTAQERQDLQTAFNEAHLGDTIRIQAGRRFYAPTGGITISKRPGSSGYLTITTTGQLPPPGVRITPNWRNQLPTILNYGDPTGLRIMSSVSGGAEKIHIRGIRFAGCGRPVLEVGQMSGTSDSDQPDDIILEQLLFENENWGTQCGRFILLNSRKTVVRDSWMAGAMWAGGEMQAICALNGPGPFYIENNYIADINGENVIFGGTAPTYRNLGHSGQVRLNALINHEERLRYSRWRPRMVVYKGRIISPSSAGSPTFQAMTSGITGSVEPSWPSTVGSTVQDNDITWRLVYTGTTHLTVKNNFEFKNAVGVSVYHNHIAGMWVDGQYELIVYKLTNCPSGRGTGCDCVPGYSGVVNTNGTTVTSADGNPLPNIMHPTQAGRSITINGVQYSIANFVPDDDFSLVLSSSAGVQSNVPYSYGDPACRPAWLKHVTFERNRVEDGPLGFQVTSYPNAVRSQVGDIVVRHNLITRIDPARWAAADGARVNARYYTWISSPPRGFRFENNTVDGQNADRAGMILLAANNQQEDKYVIRKNIWPVAAGLGIFYTEPTMAESQAALDSHLCKLSPCTTEQWDANVIAGIPTTRYSVGRLWNLCASPSGCAPPADYNDPVHGPLFDDVSRGLYLLRPSHPAVAAGAGADFLDVPTIRSSHGIGPHVITTSTSALFSYWVHAPQIHTACSVEISTTRDMDSRIAPPVLDSYTDVHDGVPRSGNGRYILVTGLLPGTTYYYRLHCGAVHEGSFQTAPSSSSGMRPLVVSFVPSVAGNYRLQWGSSYSRASDSISGGGYGSFSACGAGVTCTVSATASSGFVFYRVTGPVQGPVEVAH